MNQHLTIADTINRGARRTAHRECPWCLEVPAGLARRVGQTWLVGCESDACAENRVCAQASGDTPEAAWAAWNTRHG